MRKPLLYVESSDIMSSSIYNGTHITKVWECCYYHWVMDDSGNRYVTFDDNATWVRLYNYYSFCRLSPLGR